MKKFHLPLLLTLTASLTISPALLGMEPPLNLDKQLLQAAETGATETIKQLIGVGANVQATTYGGTTPLHIAARNGHTETVTALINQHKANLHAKNDCGWTPLHVAALNGHTGTVTALIDHGADVGAKENQGCTPLHLAARNGHTDTVTALITQHNADVGAKDDLGYTPLHLAARNGHTDTVTVLITAGTDVHAKTNRGDTPLHHAALSGQTDIVTALITQLNADVDAKNKPGRTPLHLAAYWSHTDTVNTLIQHGANPYILNSIGGTAQEVAAWSLGQQWTKKVEEPCEKIALQKAATCHMADIKAFRQAMQMQKTGLPLRPETMLIVAGFLLSPEAGLAVVREKTAPSEQRVSPQTIQTLDEERAYRFGLEELEQQHRRMIKQARTLALQMARR